MAQQPHTTAWVQDQTCRLSIPARSEQSSPAHPQLPHSWVPQGGAVFTLGTLTRRWCHLNLMSRRDFRLLKKMQQPLLEHLRPESTGHCFSCGCPVLVPVQSGPEPALTVCLCWMVQTSAPSGHTRLWAHASTEFPPSFSIFLWPGKLYPDFRLLFQCQPRCRHHWHASPPASGAAGN